MSDLLGIGASGVRAYSRALQTVGDNVANAQTAGYARRAVVLSEQPAGGSSVLYRNQVSPGGVLATGVTRSIDPWLIEDARVASSDAGRTATRLNWLEAAEAALADGGAGVGRAMTGMFNRADELAADPGNPGRRTGFLQSIDDVASAFRRTADGLSRAADGVRTAATLSAGQLNTDVEALSRINEGLRRAREGSSNQATLLDERDRLVDTITTALPAAVTFDAKGAVTLTLPGGPLLSGADRATVAVSVGVTGTLSLMATFQAATFAVAPSSGALAGMIDGAGHIAAQRTALDGLAGSLAGQINAQHAAGRDANGGAGVALLTGTGAAALTAVALLPADVAAADATTANGNALAFGNLRGATGGEAQWTTLAALQSQQVASARAQDDVATSRRDGSAAARDALSSIDLDREAGELLRFQQAYEASARVIQVARETMQTIFDAL